MMAYAAGGVSIPRTTYTEVAAGLAVYDPAQIAAGDLLFTMGSDPIGGLPGHVGMALGSGLVIDAPQTGRNVEIKTLASWLARIVAIRRIVA
jgi:cell wall-associated NlpC family hydrolase